MDLVFLDLLYWDYDVATPLKRPLGGSQSALCYLAVELAHRGHRVMLCCSTSRPRDVLGVRCLAFKNLAPEFWKQPFDALIALNAPAERSQEIRAHLLPSTPLVLWSQYAVDQPYMQALQDQAVRQAWDVIVCVSDWHRATVIQKFQADPNRVFVQRNAIAPAFENLFASSEALTRAKATSPMLAYTSTPYRGLDVLLQVFPGLRKEHPQTLLRVYSSMKVYLVGEKEDEYAALYKRCQSLAGVEYIGSLPQPRLAAALAGTSILAYPNTYPETSCIAVLEALAVGLNVVTSDLGALPETTLGFARLVPPPSGTRSLKEFVADYGAALRDTVQSAARDPRRFAEQRLEQVQAVNAQCTWRVRAQQWEEAVPRWKQLVSMQPKVGATPVKGDPLQFALQQHQAGRLQEAEQLYRQILQADPRHADALHLFGVLAYQCGRNDEAIQKIGAAIALKPTCAAYHNNLGLAYRAARNLAGARAAHEQALRLDPGYATAHANLGTVLRELSRLPEAVACYEQAVRCQPRYAEAHLALGKSLQDLGRLPEALASHEEAVRLQPGLAEAHYHRGEVLEDLGRQDEAVAAYREALRCQPDHVEARHQAGQLLEDLGRAEDARQLREELVRTSVTDGAKLRAALATPAVFQTTAHMHRQRQQLEDNLQLLAEQQLSLDDPLTQVGHTNFYAVYHGLNDRSLQAHLAALYARATPSLSYVAPHCHRFEGGKEGEPLRVGFVSSFFHSHTIGEVNLGLIRNLSRQVCRVILFPFPGPEDPLAAYIRASADEVVPLPPALEPARRLIAEQGLDVLFYTDIGMEPLTYFLAFARLARVQCVTWGHPVTTGLATIDHYLSSDALEPPEAAEHYTERLVRMGNLPTYYYAPAFIPPAKTRAYFGLSEQEHLYLCPQAPFKVQQDYDSILGDILRADPLGRVLFIRSQTPNWTHQLLRRWQRTLPDVVERIQFLPHQGGQDYLHLLNVCDALLDTTPFGGGNTTYKAFSVGAPLVTLPGAFARGRVTSACYRKMGILDCIAKDRADYVRIALRLGTDKAWREQVRSRIRQERAVLFENPGVLRELEQFLVDAVRRTQVGAERAETIRIEKNQEYEPRRLLVQCVMGSPPCNRVRILEPNQLLDTIPGTRTYAAGPDKIDLDLGQAQEEKVFVWQRAALAYADGMKLQKALLAKDYLIVAELDDDPGYWPAYADSIAFTLRSCHCVQTSTEPLAERLRGLNPHVAIFPNQLASLPPPRTYDDSTVTVFFGAWGREEDWATLMPAINRVLTAQKTRVRVRVINDRAFFDALTIDHKDFEPACAFERYQAILRSCDIGLLPLNPTACNVGKSDLKFLECAGQGVAVLASPTVYEKSIVDGETGLIYRSTAEFENGLATLIENQTLRRRLAENAYDWVRKHRLLSQHYRARYTWYLQMRARLPSLTNDLRLRVPGLFA